jgi:hypothetical protein
MYPEDFFHFLPIRNYDIEYTYYNVQNDNRIAFILQENDVCRQVGFLNHYESSSHYYDTSSHPFYSIHHNSIFQVIQYFNEILLIRIQLGATINDAKTSIIPIDSIEFTKSNIRICGVSYQDTILILNRKRLDFVDFSGKIIRTLNLEKHRLMDIYDLCCTEKTIIIICSYVNQLRELTYYFAMFFDLETLSYSWRYDFGHSSEFHQEYYNNNIALTYSLSHDIAVLCSIDPDEFIVFKPNLNKEKLSRKDVEDCLVENTDLLRDISKMITSYLGELCW